MKESGAWGGGGGAGRRCKTGLSMTHRFREVVDGKVNESRVLLVFT